MRSSQGIRLLLLSSLVVGCADARDAPEDDETPTLAQTIDGGPRVDRSDGGAVGIDGGARDADGRDGGAAAASDAGELGGGGVDLTGTWFAKVQAKADITAPLVGTAPSDVALALRLYVSKEGDALQANVEVCNLDTKSGSLSLNFDKVEPFIKVTEAIPDFEAKVGGKVPLPDVLFRIGQDESGASVDIDGDGKPGATIPSVALGAVPFDAYVGIDLKIAMDATLEDEETVAGTATFSADGKLFGSGIPLVSSGAVGVKQTSTPTTFEAKRYEGDKPCAELLEEP